MLEVKKYLQLNSLEKLTEEFAIKVRRHSKYPNLVGLVYCQIDSPKLHPIVRECRGLILDETNNWSVVAYPFFRFFNYEEGGADKIDWNTATTYTKLDGCCHEDTILMTEVGEKSIKTICEEKYSGKVLSFNMQENKITFDQIIGHSIKTEVESWYLLELENGMTIKLTGNHQVWVSNENKYKKVEDFNGTEIVVSI